MRFNSNKELVSFIGVVASVNNAALPLYITNIGSWLNEKGFNKHIHLYETTLLYNDNDFVIRIADNTKSQEFFIDIPLLGRKE